MFPGPTESRGKHGEREKGRSKWKHTKKYTLFVQGESPSM